MSFQGTTSREVAGPAAAGWTRGGGDQQQSPPAGAMARRQRRPGAVRTASSGPTGGTAAAAVQAARPDDPKWPFVAGFTNATEVLQPRRCRVAGQLPRWLSGVLYRCGPGIFDVDVGNRVVSFRHWFDGPAMVHRFEIRGGDDGGVWYRNRLTGRDYLTAVEVSGHAGLSVAGVHDPNRTLMQWLGSLAAPRFHVNVSVSVTPELVVPGKTTAAETVCVLKTDAAFLHEMDPVSLEPKRRFMYGHSGKDLQGLLSCAHEEYDPVTQSYINFVATPGLLYTTYTVFEVSKANPSGIALGRFSLDKLHYIHSLSSTRKYVVLPLWPLTFQWSGLKFVASGSVMDGYNWDPTALSRFVVIDRQERRVVAHYQFPAKFCFHTINAFDDDETGDICLDLSLSTDHSAFQALLLDQIMDLDVATLPSRREKLRSTFTRIRLPDISGATLALGGDFSGPLSGMPRATVDFEIPDVSIDLARINEEVRHDGAYRYVYGLSAAMAKHHNHVFMDSIAKIDVRTKTHLVWGKIGLTPSEPVFVKNPDGVDEDDGVLLTVVLDSTQSQSALYVLDAKTLEEVAVASLSVIVPFHFHGSFLASKL